MPVRFVSIIIYSREIKQKCFSRSLIFFHYIIHSYVFKKKFKLLKGNSENTTTPNTQKQTHIICFHTLYTIDQLSFLERLFFFLWSCYYQLLLREKKTNKKIIQTTQINSRMSLYQNTLKFMSMYPSHVYLTKNLDGRR